MSDVVTSLMAWGNHNSQFSAIIEWRIFFVDHNLLRQHENSYVELQQSSTFECENIFLFSMFVLSHVNEIVSYKISLLIVSIADLFGNVTADLFDAFECLANKFCSNQFIS